MTPQQLLEKMMEAMQEHADDSDGVIVFVVGKRSNGRMTVHGGSNLDMPSIEKVVRMWLESPEGLS